MPILGVNSSSKLIEKVELSSHEEQKEKDTDKKKRNQTKLTKQPTKRKVSVMVKPPEIVPEAYHHKNKLFARVKIVTRENGDVAKLSKGDNETVQLVKHHLKSEMLQKEIDEEREREKEGITLSKEEIEEKKRIKKEEEEQEEMFDPEATFLLIDKWPFFLISHDSNFLGHWDFMILILVLFQAIQAPFEIAFDEIVVDSRGWDIMVMFVFLIDFLHNFTTTYADRNGDIVINGEEIVRSYCNTVWFWIDMISSIPYDLIDSGDSSGTSNIKIAKLLRLARMGKILKRVDSLTKAGTIRLVRLIGMLLLFFHWTSCGWWAIGHLWFCRLKGFDLHYLQNATNAGPDFLDNFPVVQTEIEMTGLEVENKMCSAFVTEMVESEELGIYNIYFASFYQASTTLMGSGGAFTAEEQGEN